MTVDVLQFMILITETILTVLPLKILIKSITTQWERVLRTSPNILKGIHLIRG